MKLLGISTAAIVLCFAGIGIGVGSNLPTVTMGAFCLWLPSIWVMGYATARAGVSITISNNNHTPAVRQRRERQGDF